MESPLAPRRTTGWTIWRYSWKDSVPLAITGIQLFGNFWLAATWEQRSLLEIFLLWPIFLGLFWYNPIISTHNFLHTPFFRWNSWNSLYRAINSINLGLPQILYRYHHLNHHRHNNDPVDLSGQTQDNSSTFAYGREGKHESVIPYSALGLFRPSTTQAYLEAQKKGQLPQFFFELLMSLSGLSIMTWLSWQFFLFFYVPTFYFGWFLAHMENYYEHYGANPHSRYADSISFYGSFYNFLFCNEGYHQEHHLRPQVHWVKRPAILVEFNEQLNESSRFVSKVPPILGFLERRPNRPCSPESEN
ncbi:MAG: fatty acid desaturase [Planctomycetota bacterium]|nr:fatty acid desaturase [Planctomycetota bacterium]